MSAGIAAGMESDSDDDFHLNYGEYRPSDGCSINQSPQTEAAPKLADVISNDDQTLVGKRGSVTPRLSPRLSDDQSSLDSASRRRYRTEIYLGVPSEDFRVAILEGNSLVVKSIVEKGFDVNAVLKAGWTGLMYACSCGHPEIVSFLLEQKANPNFHKDMFTPLMAVCASSKDSEDDLIACAEHLIKFEADIRAVDRRLVTPLMLSSRGGRSKVVDKLLKEGADIDAQDSRGWTALAYAVSRGHGALVRQLLVAGACTKKLCRTGQTVIDLAYDHGYSAVCHNMLFACWQIGQFIENYSNADGKLPMSEMNGCSPTQPSLVGNEKSFRYGELEMFLSGLGFANLIPLFHKHEVTFPQFLKMVESDLEKIGIEQLGTRKSILEGLDHIHKMKWQKSSLPVIRRTADLSCPEVVAVVMNINAHLSYIESTIVYLRDKLENNPSVLETGLEAANISTLVKETLNSISSADKLHAELDRFKSFMQKVEAGGEYHPGDLIKPQSGATSGWGQLTTGVVVMGAIVAGLLFTRPNALGRLFS